MKPSRRLALVLFALVLALYGCSSGGQSSQSEQSDSSQADLLVIPDDYVVVNFEESTSPDHDDYGERQDQFYADLERAIQNKTEKICIRNTLPLEYMQLFKLDHGVFWLKSMGATTKSYFAQTASDTEKTSYEMYDFY